MLKRVSQIPRAGKDLSALSLNPWRCVHQQGATCVLPNGGNRCLTPKGRHFQYFCNSASVKFKNDSGAEACISPVYRKPSKVYRKPSKVYRKPWIPNKIKEICTYGPVLKYNVKLSNEPECLWEVNGTAINVTSAQHHCKKTVFTFQLYQVVCVNERESKQAWEIIFEDEEYNPCHLVVKEDNTVCSQPLSQMKKQSSISWPEIQPALWVNRERCGVIKLEALTKPGFYLLTSTSRSANHVNRHNNMFPMHDRECPSLYLKKYRQHLVPDSGRYTLLSVRKPSLGVMSKL